MPVILFKKHYFIIIIILFISIGSAFFTGTCYGNSCYIPDSLTYDYTLMNPEYITSLVEKENIFLLDVREFDEYESVYIKNSHNIPLGNLSNETVQILPQDKPIYVYCRSGNRSEEAKNILQNMGYLNTFNLGGIIEWEKNGGQLQNN